MKNKYLLSSVSLIYPCFNEATNIEEAIKQAELVLPKIANKYEIIVANDGSTDASAQIVKRLRKANKRIRLISQVNKGYGGALKLGFYNAKYDWVFFTDADLQFDLGELQKFIKFTNKHEAIIGYRKKRVEGLKRDIFARLLKIWNRIILQFPAEIRDIDCAFKLINLRLLESTFPLISDGNMLSTELLLKIQKNTKSIKQLGVNHYARASGKAKGTGISVISKAVYETFLLKRDMTMVQVKKYLEKAYIRFA